MVLSKHHSKTRWDVIYLKTKQELRKEILKLRDAMPVDERARKSGEIAKQLIAYKNFQKADKILLFASYKSEVDTTEIFEAARRFNKDVYYPKVLGEKIEFYLVQSTTDLKEGYRGIREPETKENKKFVAQPNEKICVIMPGAVFDETGNRIGYGGGYYDKFLQKIEMGLAAKNISKVAVAFQCQIVALDEIKKETHDIKIDVVVTERKIIETH